MLYADFVELSKDNKCDVDFKTKSFRVNHKAVDVKLKNQYPIEDVLSTVENLYKEFKYSYPSECESKYFKCLKAKEMTEKQMVEGNDRNLAKIKLESFILCSYLNGSLKWDDKVMGGSWFWQGRDKDLIILKEWF